MSTAQRCAFYLALAFLATVVALIVTAPVQELDRVVPATAPDATAVPYLEESHG